jgi:hypothetical protein
MLRQLLARLEALEAEERSRKSSSKRHLPDWLLRAWVARGLRVGRRGQPDQEALREFFHKAREAALTVMDKENGAEDEVSGGAEE